MSIKFKRIREVLTKEAYEDFEDFITGQTVTMTGVYEDDFIRWINKLRVVD